MKYAVTGATGHFGQMVIKELLTIVNEDELVAIARNTDKAAKLLPSNIEIRQGDYDDEASMEAALQGVDRLLFISSQPGGKIARQEQHQNVINAVKADNVKFVAYTSFPDAPNSNNPLAADHKYTETAIGEAGIAHSFLRNNFYLEDEKGFLQPGVTNHKVMYWTDGKAGWALEREFAEAAAKIMVLEQPKLVYELAGELRSMVDLGLALQQALDHPVVIENLTKKEYEVSLEQDGLDTKKAAMFASFEDPLDDGSLAHTSDDLVEVLEHPLVDLPTAINEVLGRNSN